MKGVMLQVSTYYKNGRLFIITSPLTPNNLDPLGSGDSKRSDYVARRRAFSRAEAIIYLHSNLTEFHTLTYASQHSNYTTILNDLKNVFTRRKISYIAVVEKHKSGNYHIHAITSPSNSLVSLRKGKNSLAIWHKGYSDSIEIKSFDKNFKPFLYLFKYMMKSEKIGGRYFLKSNDLTVVKNTTDGQNFHNQSKKIKSNFVLEYSRNLEFDVNGVQLKIIKEYYRENNH